MIAKLIQPAVLTLLAIAVVATLGYVPSRRFWGSDAWVGMALGCGVGVLTHWIGLSAYLMAGPDGIRQPQTVLMSTAIRFGVVLVLTLAAALSGIAEKGPLLIWVAISYMVGLFMDTLWLVRQKHSAASEKR